MDDIAALLILVVKSYHDANIWAESFPRHFWKSKLFIFKYSEIVSVDSMDVYRFVRFFGRMSQFHKFTAIINFCILRCNVMYRKSSLSDLNIFWQTQNDLFKSFPDHHWIFLRPTAWHDGHRRLQASWMVRSHGNYLISEQNIKNISVSRLCLGWWQHHNAIILAFRRRNCLWFLKVTWWLWTLVRFHHMHYAKATHMICRRFRVWCHAETIAPNTSEWDTCSSVEQRFNSHFNRFSLFAWAPRLRLLRRRSGQGIKWLEILFLHEQTGSLLLFRRWIHLWLICELYV